VSHLLSEEQKESHDNTCLGFHERLERDPRFLSKLITGDGVGLQVSLRSQAAVSLEGLIMSLHRKWKMSLFKYEQHTSCPFLTFMEFCIVNLLLEDNL
jgi:hypothetical protein